MAKVTSNVMMRGLSGTLGRDFFVRTMRDGSTIVSAKPDFSHRKFSQEQLTHQSRFQSAVAYARVAAKTNPIYAQLATGTTKSAYNIALSDWFNPPVIHDIKRLNGTIHVDASDNILVHKVLITIMDEAGNVLEQGQAMQVHDTQWDYVTATEGKIRAEAWDLAGNKVVKEG